MPAGRMIDFHAHILPGADHGSDGVETSCAQLSLLAGAGVRAVVATPHFYPSKTNIRRFLALREATVAALADARKPGWPPIYLGAEVNICHNLERMPELDRLTVMGTDTLLVEMPLMKWDDALIDTLLAIRDTGFRVVPAHLDRYDEDAVEALFTLGFRGQLNAEAFAPRNFLRRRRFLGWIDDGMIVALGSDIHGADAKSTESLTRMYKLLGDERLAHIMTACAGYLEGAMPLFSDAR